MTNSSHWIWGIIGLFYVFLLVVIFQPISLHTYGRTIVDDGYYYLGYAHNIASGNGPTFDGIVETNGVQPLWALLLTIVAKIFNNRIDLVYASLFTAGVLAFLSIINVNSAIKPYIKDSSRWLVILLFSAFAFNPQMSLTGMETALNIFIVTLTLRIILNLPNYEEVNNRHLLVAGILIGLSGLARIDNLIIAPVFALIILWRTQLWHQLHQGKMFIHSARVVIIVAIPALLIFGAYLLFNQTVFGRLLPISGEIKSVLVANTFAENESRFSSNFMIETTNHTLNHIMLITNDFFWLILSSYGPATLFVRFALVGLCIVGLYVVIRRLKREKSHPHPRFTANRADTSFLILVTLGILFHTWMIFFNLGVTMAQSLNWYYVPEYILIMILVALFIDLMFRWQQPSEKTLRIMYGATAIFILIGSVTYLTELQGRPDVSPLNAHYEAALWANENLDATRIGGSFNAGVVGYFTDISVINLDGLMNDEGILAVVRGENDIWNYVQSQDIDYIIDYSNGSWDGTATTFRGIPMDSLIQLSGEVFINWGFVESTFHIFEINASE